MKPQLIQITVSAKGHTVEPDEPALVAALAVVRNALPYEMLVRYALSRQSFCDTDGFFGVTYPEDLDEYDKEVDGITIPEGFVEVIAWFGQHHGPSHLLEESTYRDLLRQYLVLVGRADLAQELAHPTVRAVFHLPGPVE